MNFHQKGFKEIKKALLLFTLIFSVQFAFCQIRLDSIVIIDLNSQVIFDTYRFTYEGDLITAYNGYYADYDIEYNSNGDFEKWTVQNDLEESYSFIYDSNMQLDSVISSSYAYGYLYETYSDYTYENGILVKLNLSDIEGGYGYKVQEDFFYLNDLLDSIAISDMNFGLYASRAFDYNSDGQLVEARYRDFFGEVEQKWVTTYDVTGQLQVLQEFDYYNNPDKELKLSNRYQYDYESTIPFSEIQTPHNVIEIRNTGGISYSPELLIPFRYSTQVSSIEHQFFMPNETYSFEYFYYYSSTVGTSEERIVMTPISLSPNPTTDYININIEKDIESISILAMDGQLILRQASASKQVDVQALSHGHYTIIVDLVDGSHVFGQFIKH